jgi:bifunctional oligoribonuclease and PAP phosphatase NrnA
MTREISDILRNDDRFLVVTHVNPDGDAVGSLLGMHLALHEMGKKSWPMAGEALPGLYDFLPGREDLILDPAGVPDAPDWIISLDAAEESRISGDISRFRDSATLINVDHHPTNPGFGDINLVDPGATSTAELVFTLLGNAGYRLSLPVAKCLYSGLVTDTGCFRFAGVDGKTLALGARLLEVGLDSYEITRYLFEEFPVARLHLERLILERLEIMLEGRLILSNLYAEDFDRLGADFNDSEHLVNRLREVRGVEVAALMTTMSDKLIRVSLRSKGRVDVASIAASLGGGGHRRAAGIKSPLSMPELRARFVQAVREALS